MKSLSTQSDRLSAAGFRQVLPRRKAGAGRLLSYTLAALAFSAHMAAAQTAPIKIGLVLAKQGFSAELGASTVEGAEIALQHYGAKSTTQPIETIWYDEPDPQAAQQNFTKLVEQDKVVAVIGGTNSGTALAMAATANQLKIPLIVTGASAREITGKNCNRYTFRIPPPVPTAAAAMAPLMLKRGKNWYFVVASYAYGQDTRNSFGQEMTKGGGKSLGDDVVPGGTTDFSSYILKVRRAKPDLVMVGVGGSDMNSFIKQYEEYGLDKTIPLFGTYVSDTQIWALGEKASGTFGKTWHYTNPSNSPEEKNFIKTYQEKYKKPPNLEAWNGWTSMRLLLAGMAEAKSTKPKDLVTALESMKVENGDRPLWFRSWDHQLMHPVLVVQGKAPAADDKWNGLDIVLESPPKGVDIESIFGTKAEVGCTPGEL